MNIEDLDLAYSAEEIREFIQEAVARKGTRHQPRFYAVTGSHVYGFDSPESDIDVRGLHVAPVEEYAYLRTPAGEVTINMDGRQKDSRGMPRSTFGVTNSGSSARCWQRPTTTWSSWPSKPRR